MKLSAQERKDGVLSAERTAEALRAFRDTGLVLIEDAYDPDFIAEVRAAYDKELTQYLDALGGLEAMEGKTFGKNHIGFFPPLHRPIADGQIVAHPIATQLLTTLLGPELQCSFFHTNTAFPDSGFQGIHRDYPQLFGTEMSVPNPVTHIVLNIPLCDFNETNGSTEFWPSTHLIVDKLPDDAKALEARIAGMHSIRLNMPLGSFALRDMRGWHRGVPNSADYARTMFAVVYTRGFMREKPTTIPKSTWDSWPETARHIFRRNPVVEDVEHRPITWEQLREP